MTTTIAIAGLGAAARRIHLPAYARIGQLQVVGGCDPLDARRTANAWPFPLFASAEEMLDRTRPDILAVVAPPAEHFALIRLGLSAGCHVFCEKPFVSTLDEADEVVRLAAQAGRQVVVNNQYRFMNIHRAAQQQIGSADFGRLLFVDVRQTFLTTPETEAGWRGGDRQRTCKEFGTHALDLCRFFFGEEPRAIRARMPRAGDENGADLLNLIQLDFSGDRVAHLCLDRLCRGPHRYLDIRLDGSAGCIETHLGGGLAVSAGVRGGTRRPFAEWDISGGGRARLYHGQRFRKIASDPLDLFARATGRLLTGMLQAIETGQPPPCHAADNRRTLALMLAAYDSAERNQTIELTC